MKKLLLLLILSVLVACSQSTDTIDLTLMSYNVRHGVSMNWKPALKQQAGIIKAQKPDWVGLQEIDNRCNRSGKIDQAREYGELTGMSGYFGKFMDFDSGQYGMAVLSGLDVTETERLELPQGAEPRIAIIQTIKLKNNVQLILVNVHFDWTKPELRVPQAERLIRRLNEINLPAIVLGDYNAEPESPTLKFFEKSGFLPVKKSENNLTWNAAAPTVEIDHIYYRPSQNIAIKPVSITVLNEPEASDHRPVVAKIKITKK